MHGVTDSCLESDHNPNSGATQPVSAIRQGNRLPKAGTTYELLALGTSDQSIHDAASCATRLPDSQ